LSDFKENLIFSGILKYTQVPNFTKIGPLSTEFFHAGGQTDG